MNYGTAAQADWGDINEVDKVGLLCKEQEPDEDSPNDPNLIYSANEHR